MGKSIYMPRLWKLTIKINDCFEKVLKPMCKKYGLTMSQLKIIYFMHKFGAATVGSVAKVTGFAKTNTSAMCKKLHKHGYLSRKKSKKDERIVEIELTREGMTAAEDVENAISEYEGLSSSEDLQSLEALMESVIRD